MKPPMGEIAQKFCLFKAPTGLCSLLGLFTVMLVGCSLQPVVPGSKRPDHADVTWVQNNS